MTTRDLPGPGPRALGPRTRPRADGRAVALLHRTAATLMADLPGLTDRLVSLLQEQEPVYRNASVNSDELWQEVHESLENNVQSLMRPKENRETARLCSWRIGAERAEQGMPLDALLHAFRLGGAMVWQGLVDIASRDDPDEFHLLVHLAADVWNFVDEHCGLVAEAYRRVESQLTRRHEERLRALVGALLDGTTRIADVPAAAAALDLPEHGRYAVIVVAGTGRPVTVDGGAVAGVRIVWHTGTDGERGIALLGDTGVEQLAGALTPPPGGRIGVSPVVAELTALGNACQQAETALRTCAQDGQVVLFQDHLPAAMVVSCPDTATALATRVLGPILDLEPVDREVLLTTLAAWLDSDGSALRAGARLFCHRNTVLNRLRRFEQLTGRSLSRPRDVVELSLALDAHRLLPVP
ncbi:PucR family transcriptional regulator [Goodfellowiella coeruleoviolacea]|nr:helix-turn-helix domain-containing protein [Goodfellowiella coeruleoviolacea]